MSMRVPPCALLAVPLLALALPAWAADAARTTVPPPAAAAPSAAAAAPGESGEAPTVADDREVMEASEKWLRLIDQGHLGVAWDESAAALKAQVTRAQWIDGIGAARKPLGALKARTRDRFARTHDLPGAPSGDYAIVMFRSQFANGKRATEELVWKLEPDGGIWRVSAYHIL